MSVILPPSATQALVEFFITPAGAGIPIEVERALDNGSGSPDLTQSALVASFGPDEVPAEGVQYQDLTVTADGAYRHYRFRHAPGDRTPSAWTSWFRLKPVLVTAQDAGTPPVANVTRHAATHATDGTDPLSPAQIGALSATGYAVGQVLLGQADGTLAKRKLVAGANVTIVEKPTTGELEIAAAGGGGGGGGGTGARGTISYTTPSLTPGATDSTTLPLGASWLLLQVTATAACRVRLYRSAATRGADVGRAIGVRPIAGSGVLCDLVFAPGTLTIDLAPLVSGATTDGTAQVAAAITNTGGTAAALTLSLSRIPLES